LFSGNLPGTNGSAFFLLLTIQHSITSPVTTSALLLNDTVSISKQLERWKMLNDSEPLAQLHKAFWEKDLVKEENA
jgi:hypothetical protein